MGSRCQRRILLRVVEILTRLFLLEHGRPTMTMTKLLASARIGMMSFECSDIVQCLSDVQEKMLRLFPDEDVITL